MTKSRTNMLRQCLTGSLIVVTEISCTEPYFAYMQNGPYLGTFWHRDGPNAISEFNIATMTDIQTLFWADVVNMFHTVSGMGRYVFMPSINCIHMSHGTISAVSPLGGVDKVCFPCPSPTL